MADNDNRYKLWQTISKEYDLPDYNQFSKDMEDATKRKSLHDAVSAEYDLPDFDQFSKDMGYETQTTQQSNQNAQNAKKPQQTAQSSHVEEDRGLPSDNGYSKQKTSFDKAAEQAWNKLANKGGIKWTIEGHPEVKMVAVTDDLVKKFPQLEQSRGYQVPFNMSTGTPIMQNIDDKGNIITPDEASEQYTKILTNKDFDYVPKQEAAAVQIGSVVNTALSTKGGWLDRMARKSMAQYGDDWEHQKFESDGKEVSSSDVFGKVKQTIYDYYNSVLKGIRTHLMFNSDEEKQAYVDNLYKTGQLKEEDIPKANVLHYVQNVDKEEQIEAVRQAKLNRELELEMAQEKFNQLQQREKGESDFDYNDRILHEGALYEQDIRKLKKQIAQLDAVSDELQGNNTSWKEWGHAFKTSGIGSYHAWDLGATDLKDAIELNKVASGIKRGMQMTSSDYMALRVMSQANEADAIENAVMPVSYKSKKGGFISAPFTFGFFVGGDIAKGLTSAVNKVAGKVISKAVKGAVLKAGGKKALSAATNLAEKAANTKCVKLFGMLAKDVEKAAFMENTTGAATTGAEILNRHIGTVTESDDGFKMEGESLPTAIIKGEISQNIESQTEFLGEHFPSSLKFIRGMAHTKVGSAMGLRNLAAWLTKVSRTEFATTLKSYATRAGINGVFGEYLEEVAGTAENALLVGDQKFSDLLDVKQQEEVAGSVVLSCLGMGIFGTAIYTGQRGLNMPAYYRLQHLQNKWDNAGLDLFTGEEWANLKDRIDNTPNEGMKSVMADILKADNMTEEQARAAFNYARCSLTLRGMNIGAVKAAQLGLTDDRHIEQDNAYVEGRQAKDEDKHDIQIEFEDRSHKLAEKLGISEQQLDNMSDEDLESLTGKDDQLDNLIYDYQTSHARYQGVVDNADDEIDKAAQEAARQTDMATDKSRGTVRNATIKATKGEEDYGVYIVSGNVATNEDGSINVSESDDMILYYDPKSGKIEHCDAMRLSFLGEEVNAEETRNQAIADAKEKAIRKQAGIIDGTVGEGTSFTITDAEGNEHTYEVLADNGDGSAMITMDGNVQEAPVSLQDLQNLKDAEEAKILEAAKMQRQQYEEEREKQNAPVEDNIEYADIINTNGNVEIAEVVDEEGNAMFPDAEEVFFVQNQGSRAKVMVLDNEGNLQPKLVKKSSVRTLGTMSVDEYRQGRQQALKEAENASEPSIVDETEPSNNVVPTGNITTDNTTTNETQPGNEAEVTTSNETQNISNEQESTPKITLEDGTEVPMLEDGNPDFSQLTAEQVAELYDSQFGDDAEQIVSSNVNKAKKALDKANGMTVSGGSFAEQKASKKAKDKAIAEAKEKYDSAKAIADAYNERMLAKEEDTPEGRMNLIEKARRKFNRMKGSVKDNAQAIAKLYDETVGSLLHRLYDSTGIDVFDDTANTVDEYVASSIAPYSLNYEGTETSKGVKQETGLSRSDFAKTGLLAKEGKGKTIGQLANDLWRDRPSNLENITDQDVRNAIIDLITSGQTAFGLKNHIQNLRIAEAENILEQQKRQADELAHAEKQKEEEQASTELADDNTEESSNAEATPADAQEEDKLADMPFEAPSPDEDVPFSAKDKAKDPLEVWNNMTNEEKAAYIENNRVKDTRLVDDVVGKKLRKAIEKIAGMMGATVQWQRTDMIRNGWFNPNTKTIYLALDSSILEGVQFVFGHEMTHEIKSKSPAMYDELKKLVKEKYGEELFDAMTNDNEERYAGVGKTDNDRSYYEEETVADAIGDIINDLNLTHSIALKMSHPLLAKMHDVLLKIKNAFTGTPYSDNVNGIIRTIEMAYVKTANREAVNTAIQEGEGGQRLSLREKPAPKKTQKVYKLMRLGEDGKLYPLFIGSGAEVELGKWYDAESPKLQDLTSLSSNEFVGTRTVTINGVDVKEKYNYGAYIVNNETGEAMSLADFKAKYSKEFAKMGKNPNKKAVNWATDNGYRWIKIEEKKQGQSRYGGEARSYYNYGINGSGGVTTFAMRPGWHAGSLPTMRQIGKGSGKNLRDDTFVWVEGEIPADIDYNEEAQKNADKDIPDHIPTDGYYLKATNANKEASQADRVGWYVAGAFKANRIMSDKEARNIIDEWNAAHPDEEKVEYDWKRESGKDFNAETMSLDGAPKFSLKVYHGSGADFTEFDFDHMGEGAGSQSFGWGGYVTSSKKIGKSYANLVDANAPHQDVEYVGNNAHEYTDVVAGLFNGGQRDYDDVKEFLQNGYNTDKENARKKQMLEWFESTKPSDWKSVNDGKRNLYEVDIPDDNGSNYLEWEKKPSNEIATKIIEGIYGLDDKTLDDMAARDIVFRTLMYDYIKNADKEQMIPILVKTNGLTRNTVYDNGNVEDDIRFVYNRLSNWMGSPKAASKFLSSLGFTGIKYPAGTIYGGAEEGDVNYVIFKPEDMQIVEHEKFSVKSKPVRFEIGKKLSDEEKKKVLSTLKDAYKVNGVPYHIEETAGGKEKRVYEPTFDSYVVSDITNRPLRYYITLPDGRVAHPTEIYPNISDNEVKSSAAKQGLLDDEADQIVSAAIGNMKGIADNAKAVEVLTELQNLPHETHDIGYGLNNAQSYNYKTGIFTSDAAQAIDYVVRRMRRKEDVPAEIPAALKKAVADSYGMVDNLIDGMSNTKVGATEIKPVGVGAFQNAGKFSLRLQDAINETDTEPTEAQKKSGNYKKGHVKFGGYDYTIENPKGSYRSGVDENGKEWKQKMNDTYGYIRGKFGKDGDHLDMFINDNADLDNWNGDVFVVDQVNQDGTFDEHKVMYGYDSLEEAKKAYLSNYEKGWTGLGNITPVSKADFDKWLDKSNRKLKPFADYADITSNTNMDTAPSSFEEFLEHPAVRYSIRNEMERAAAEDAYNFAQENRPDRYSRYAIVNMEKPGAVPQYLEKKKVADNWRRYYNKLKWGNYKLFDLDKPFEDNVKNLVGKFPETFRKKNDTILSKINELSADYNKRKEEYDAMSNSIQELLNGLMKQGRSLAEAESVIRDWGLYKEMDSKYQNLMGIRKQLNELRSGKVADDERFSLIGKKGAEALDHAEEVNTRLDNLNVARQMEEAKKDVKAIKMATGWERGADGKWRYEIADSKLNDMMDVDGKGKMVKRHKEDMLWTSGKLGEVVVAPELFKAYPKLKDVRLETDSIMNNLPSNGEYNAKTNTITIHADELKYLNSILNHEIQHVIQNLEGFAQGGDSKHIRKVLERMINENQEASDYAKDKLKEWVTLTMAADRLSDLYKQYINSDNEWLKNKAIESYWDAMNELDNNEQSTLTNDYPDGTAREIAESGYHVDEAEKELRRLAKETKESIPEGNNSALDLVSKLTDALENNDDYNLYRKLGGEVEARNVQSRMGMSPEERRETLAEETEDVARKDQIFLYGDNDAYSLKQNKDAEYLEAVKNGDMEKAQKMVYDAARAAGYVNGTDYQGEGSWSAPSASVEKEDFANLDALRESVEEYSGDTNVFGIINGVTTNDDDFYYNPGRVGFRDAAASETSSVLRRLRYDKADANTKVKVYRTVPTDVKGNNLMSGDWIALSKQYCIEHGNGRYGEGGYRIIEEEVPIKTIWNDGNDMREFGFDDGNNNEAEKNVPNNRKLLDAVTYDNNGNVIPLSERFNESNDDIRYSLRVDRYRDELNQWKKDNNLPKDAERPQLPVREPNESAADFLKRVKEYRKQAALWATAPTYEDHLLVSDTAQGQFNLEMQRKAVLTRIVIQDSMLAIRKAQEAIMKEKGVDKLNPAEDAYTAENRSHGKAKNEFEEYNDEFLQPLRKAYNELMQRLGKSYDNVKVYMIAKHGLERNAYIAFKYALDEDYETNEERMNAYNNYKADMDRLNNDADFEAGRIDFAAWKQRDGFIRTKYAPSYFKFRFDENGMTKDYSGLSALFDADDYEGAAADLVKEVEDANPYYTDELWYATNDATKKILRDSYNAGMMTEDNFNFVSGMYRNYIPLRGWGDTNADQVWNYVGGGKGAFNQVVKEAKGRKSLADDPIAYIENMAESAILMNNRNWVKQHLLLLAQNHRTSLLNVSKAWYIKTKDAQGNEEWIPASPQITEGMTGRQVEAALESFEQKMEQMQQNGEATQKREHLEISYPQTNGEEREHEVRVMKGGEEYVIYVNGDPQLAQAVNNTRARKVREGIEESRPQRFLARTGRYMAAAYTSMSPLFIPSNYMRDLTMTLASTAIREDARYNYLLRRNMLRHWNTFPMVLSYQNGTLRKKVRNGSASRVEQMFYDFMMNGGETGFVTSVDVEDLKKKFKNDLKDLNRMAANPKKVGHIIMNSIETLNRAIEDSNRFMVYMTSIEYGRSIEEAVNNAKDVTLNFNRKGTGEHGWQAVRDMYLFINPAVQSLQTLGALAKHHPFKFTAVTTGWLATGLLVPMLNNLLMSFFGGDDDKNKYWQFTKWDRRNNFIMWIPFTKEFVKIPLAQEFRGFYGVGDMIASKLWGGEKAEESWSDYAWDLAGQIVDMLPLDPTGYDGNIGLAMTPNAVRPIGELSLNVDFTGKPIFRNSEYNKYDPNFTKAYVGTPDWLVRISKMVNSIDNKYPDVEQNAIDRFGDPKFNPNNPAVIDHLLSSYLGGSYTMGSQIIGVATKALNGDDIKMADIPLASKFVSNPDDRPVSKKQGEEFWDMKERHDRAANTLSKLKQKAKVDGDYSTLDIFFGSDEYRQYKEDDKKVKKYEEDRKKEKAQETGEEYRPHKTTADDVYKSHTTPKDDFEDMKMKQLYEKLNSYKIRYEAIDGISGERGDAYYKANKAAIDAIEEIAYDKSQIASIKKGFLSDGQNTYDADGMKDIRELRKRILDVLEKANKEMMNNRK